MQLDQITFTRFIAALTVVFFHYGQSIFPANIPFLFENVTAGPIAVGYFYVLSGFIMAIAYYQPDNIQYSEPKNINKWKYWIARFARIYPVYLIALIIMVAAKYKTLLDNVETLPLHLLMLQAWIPGYPITLNTPGWSLSVEAFFYLCFPVLLFYIYKHGSKRLIWVATILWIITQLILHLAINSDSYHAKNLLHDLVYYNPLMHLNSFIVGMLTGVYFKKNAVHSESGLNHAPQLLENSSLKKKGLRINTFLLIFSAFMIVFLIWFRPYLEAISGIKIAYTNGLIAPAFLLFIVLLGQDTGLISKILRHKWLILLGEASYSLYILQKPVYGLYDKIVVPRITLSETLHFYIFLILLIAISIASFRYFETPMRHYIRKRLS